MVLTAYLLRYIFLYFINNVLYRKLDFANSFSKSVPQGDNSPFKLYVDPSDSFGESESPSNSSSDQDDQVEVLPV